MITAEDVRVTFGKKTAVDNVSLTVPDTGTLGLVGPNGSGKTTLLRALYGSVPLAGGRVLLGGEDLQEIQRRQIARTIAVVAQERDATSAGVPMSVAELVMLGRLPHQTSASHDREVVTGALDAVGMTALARRDLAELSGGERQRALIARALAQQTAHILLDEPTNHLDIRFQHEILELIAGLPGSVVVLHDLNLAARYCDRIVVLQDGRVAAEGPPDEVLVPEILEPVYHRPVRRIDLDGEITLIYPRIPAREVREAQEAQKATA
ncbi:ABC transporter ATP-binding protein [Corynebacterium terpenotabidum]|uniref:Zinc ABC transport system ATP-binding protein n=1 Tax=Corynebacterium terpenotabidum Y-11 TaxID=1200352 RepID=S4XMH0_9CORY|nr:ABC transporter ATP-binding protein [Corynebacterium terpenotabidum]AGP31843.1 zinc ABC transport system ATP-binding protein [Corynebacterium terpenotabidum Y-11]